MADKNYNISLMLNFFGMDDKNFCDAIRPIRFTCEEEINRLYTLEVLFYVTGEGNPKDISVFLDKAIALRVENVTVGRDYDNASRRTQQLSSAAEKYIDGSTRMFYGRVAECERLGVFSAGANSVYHFYRIIVRPDYHYACLSHPIRTYVRPLEGNNTLTYKDVLVKAINNFNSNNDLDYYVGHLTTGSASQTKRFKVTEDFSGVNLDGEKDKDQDRDTTVLNPDFAVQYSENYHDFILRILERQGWYYYFDFDPQDDEYEKNPEKKAVDLKYVPEVMRFKSRQTIEMLGVKTSQFLDYAKQAESGLGIISKFEKITAPVTQVTVLGYNPDNPETAKAAVFPQQVADNSNAIVVPDNFFENQSEGDKLARLRYEELQCHEKTFKIKANIPGAAPGRTFVLRPEAEISDDSTGNFAEVWAADNSKTMKYFIVSAKHRGTSGDIEPFVMEALKDGDITGEPTAPGYLVEMVCVPNTGIFRPLRTKPWSALHGTVLGSLLSIDPETGSNVAVTTDNTYFIKFKGGCTSVTDLGDKATGALKFGEDGSLGPLRMQSVMSLAEAGTGTYLNAGTEVLVSFHGGDPNRPVLLGAVPNAETTQKVFHNAIVSKVESGLSAALAQDPESGDTSATIDLFNRVVNQLVYQGAKTFSNANAAFNSTTAVSLNAHASAINNSVSTFYNNMGTSTGLGVPTLTTMLADCISIANRVNNSVLLNTGKSMGKTASMTISKIPGLLGLLQMFIALGGMQMQGHRVMINASAEASNVSLRSQPVTQTSKYTNIATFALKLLNDAVKFSEAIAVRHGAEKQYNAKAPGESFYEDDAYNPMLIVADSVSLALDTWVIVKILIAACKQAVGNNGILIKASATKPSTKQTFKNQGKAFVNGLIWSSANPRAEFTSRTPEGKDGMHIALQADGIITATAGDRITLSSYANATTDPTKDFTAIPKSTITLDGLNPTPRIDISTIKMNMDADEFIHIISPKKISSVIPSKATLFLDNQGTINLNANSSINLYSKSRVNITANDTIYHKAKYHIFNLNTKKSGLLMGHYDANNDLSPGMPHITIGLDVNASEQEAQAIAEYNTALETFATADQEYNTALKEQLDLKIEIDERCSQLGDFDDGPATLADFLKADTQYVAAESAAKTKEQAFEQASATLKEKADAVTKAKKDHASSNKITLGNGNDVSEMIEVSSKDVTITSGKEITVESGEKITLNAKNATIAFSDGKITMKGGSNKVEVTKTSITLA